MSQHPPKGSLFSRPSIPTVSSAVDARRTTIYSQGIVKNGRNSLEDSKKITSITCQQSNEPRIHPKEFKPIESCKLPQFEYDIEIAQKWLTLQGKDETSHRFPLKTILPKVQMTRRVRTKQLPRDVEVYRRRRRYNKVNVMEELEKAGLSREALMPTEEQYYLLSDQALEHFLPLSFFDDCNLASHSPEAWLKSGDMDEGERFPLLANAFVPFQQSLLDCCWQEAAISEYNNESGKWTVMVLADECVYQVPSVQVMFLAENPFLFVERLKQALGQRDNAEFMIRMETLVECIMFEDLKDQFYYENPLLDRLMERVASGAELKFYKQLHRDIYVMFEHLMTYHELHKFVQIHPQEFPELTADLIKKCLPTAFIPFRSKAEVKLIELMKINIRQQKFKVLAYSLYYTEGGIMAMFNVATECLYIETLTLFICNFPDPLPLADFLEAQQEQSSQVSKYLKTSWPSKISWGISSVLIALGKGWLDTLLKKWSVYAICKISRFILQVKFRMQDSMQILLERSIHQFTHFLSEPCLQFLQLQQGYKWSSDYIHTEFPYHTAIFSLILDISENKEVLYSTQPEEFAPALKEIFKKSLEKTNGVRCINAETLINLRFAPNLFILSVELIEDLYVRCNDLLQKCYLQAVIPLLSYAQKYERFIEFYLLNVTTYMAEYKASRKPSMQVKQDILEHKRCKEEIRSILPSSITIGPFLVIVDPLKQYMIRKRIEIVKRIFEYYLDRMYDINEHLLDRCLEMYNRINEKPQSIEHLYAIREFALTIPNMVEQLRGDIQIMWIEYDMLDSFFYNLPDHQFAMKWEVYAWPKNILDRLSTLKEEQKLDMEEFKRLHLSECIGFEERLESLNDEIQQFSLQFDPKKVTETAVEVKITWKVIQDLQKHGETLRYRQQLFQLEEFSLEFLASIIEGFLPYKKLWYTCQDLVKLEEATVGNPIVNIELADVWEAMQVIKNSLHESLEVFSEKPEIQNVAHYFLQVLEEFIPKCNAIKDLKNDNWLYLHWQELSLRSGMDIKYSMAMNFQYCMRKGMMDHLELVHEISEKATNEADAIRKAWEEEERRKEEERMAILMRKAMRKCRTDIV